MLVDVMPRAKAFDPELVLDRAVELFWRRGYDGASMAKLLEFMGISRQSLYDTFGDKHRLFLAAMDRYKAKLHDRLEEIFTSHDTGIEGIRATFAFVESAVLEDPEHRSCLMANAALELGQSDPEVRARVREHLAAVEDKFYLALERDRQAGRLSEERNTRALARFLTNAIHGLGVMARGGASREVLDDSIATTLAVC